WE
ncbi:hypothetical protein V3C99_012092, partial [Haemonchus contortus]